MRTTRVLFSIARADFLERVRTYSFLLTLGVAVFLAWQVHLGNIGLSIGGKRSTMNSAWLGAILTLVATLFLSLSGFYMIKNSVARDMRTGVGQILAATPLSRAQYVFGKAISNFAVLASMVLVLAIGAPGLQLLAAEDRNVDLIHLLTPFLLIALPAMTLIAAVAVLFENVRWLQGAVGNIVYMLLFSGVLIVPLKTGYMDPTGISLFRPGMESALRAVDPNHSTAFAFGAGPRKPIRGFEWNGLDWKPVHVAQSFVWPAVAIAICALAALRFDRFDSSAARRTSARPEVPGEHAPPKRAPLRTQPLPPVSRRRSFAFGFLNELRLMLARKPWSWYLGAAGAIIAGLLVPPKVLGYVLAFAWIWPLLLWSQMGGRETAFGTGQIIFSAPHPVRRQLPATWLAGVAVAFAISAGAGARMIMNGDWPGLGAIAVGALLPPSMALCFGVWSGGSKLFEAFYTLFWYVGPVSRLPVCDFTFSSGNVQYLPAYIGISFVMVLLAFVRRRV